MCACARACVCVHVGHLQVPKLSFTREKYFFGNIFQTQPGYTVPFFGGPELQQTSNHVLINLFILGYSLFELTDYFSADTADIRTFFFLYPTDNEVMF